MMGPPMGRGREEALAKLKEPKPKSLKEVPGYLHRVISKFFKRLLYIFELVWEAKPAVLFVMIVYCIVSGAMPVIGAYINAGILNSLADAYTSATGGEPVAFRAIVGLLVLKFAYTFINSLINTAYNILVRISGEVVTNHIKIKILNKARQVDLASFDMPEFYEKMENASREAGNRPITILQSAFNIVSTVISVVSYIVILAAISSWAPLIVIAVSIPTAIISFVFRKKNFMYMRFRSKDRRQMSYYNDVMVDKDTAKEIRIFNLSDIFIENYKKTFKKYFSGIKKLILHEGEWNGLMSLFTSAVNCGLFVFVADLVRRGIAKIGDYSLYTGALDSISNGVSELISTTAVIYEGTLFIDNMIAFMDEKPKIVPALKEPLSPQRGTGHTIEFRNVSFSYPGTERKVIDNVSFTLKAGETVVLVGLNGAGKTTLIKLLTRLYDPTEGVILLDGRDIRDYDVQKLYDMFGIIFQDFGKYAFSAGENIMFGQTDKGYVKPDIENAAHMANADVFINKLSRGLDTPLMRYFEADGVELSVGQWQKLSVARAFYSESDFLILDEPTASLDPMAEQEIFSQFDKLRKDKTTIFVSHRLSSATTATKIIVMEYGRIIETGSHTELMKKHGRYYELFTTQAKRYITDPANQSLYGAAEGGLTPDTGSPKDNRFPPLKRPGDFPPPPAGPAGNPSPDDSGLPTNV